MKPRGMRWEGHIARVGESRDAYRVLVGKSDGRRSSGRRRPRREDNIKMDLGEMVCGCMDRIDFAQDCAMWRAFVNAVMNLWVQ